MSHAPWSARASSRLKQRADAPGRARHHRQPFLPAEDREVRRRQSRLLPVDAVRSQTMPAHGAARPAVHRVQAVRNILPDVPPKNCASLPGAGSGPATRVAGPRRNSRSPLQVKTRRQAPLRRLREQPYIRPGNTRRTHTRICFAVSCLYEDEHNGT